MKSKLPWIAAGALGLGMLLSIFLAVRADNSRRYADSQNAIAQKAKLEADEAARKALAAREAAESAQQKSVESRRLLNEQLSAAQSALTVAQRQLSEQSSGAPAVQSELDATRKALAELQRAHGDAPKVVAPIVAAKPQPPQRAPGGWSVPNMLPPDTLGLITVRDVPTSIVKAKETGIYKILTHPDFERVFRKQLGQVRGVMFAGEVMLGTRASDLLAFLSQGEITFAVLGVDKRLPNGAPLADLMLSIELRDKAPAFVEEFNKRLDQLKAATAGNLQYTQTPLGETIVTRFTYPDFPGSISCGLCDGTFLICLGEGRLEKLMAMHQKMKTAAPPAADAAPEVLAQVATFKKALEKAGPDADVMAFANIDAITANVIINDPNKDLTATQKHDLNLSGLREVKAFSYALTARDNGVRESVFLDVPVTRRNGLLGLIDSENADMSAFYAAPRSSVLAWSFKINPEQLLEKAVALAALEDPQAREKAATGLLFIGQLLNIDPKKDMLGAFTGQGVFSLSVPYKNAKLALAFPQPIVALRIKDQDGIRKLTKALVNAGQEKMEFIDTVEGGKTITIARERERPADGVHQFCFVIDGDDLLLSIYPLALREEIRRRAGKGSRLDDDPDFNLARANLSGQPQAMLYVDSAALAVAAYDVLVPIAQFQAKDVQIDINALPTGDVLSQNLGSALVGLHFAADGVLLEGYSPGGVFSVLIPAAIGGKIQQMRNAAQNDFNVPAAPLAAMQPRNQADIKKIQTLEKLARDLKEYAVEHGGSFPKKLDDMRPKYLQDLGKDVEQIVYLGKQAAENRIVAHSSDKLPGNIAILTQSGTVQSILRSMLGKVLREGFLDTSAPVKPPKQPEF